AADALTHRLEIGKNWTLPPAPLVIEALFGHTIGGIDPNQKSEPKDMRLGTAGDAPPIHDHCNASTRTAGANLVQYGPAPDAVRLARPGGGARRVPGAVPQFCRRRGSAGAKDLRNLRTQGCGGDRLARDVRAP